MSEEMETVDALVKARELIEKPENWCQNNLHLSDRSCAVGALERAFFHYIHYTPRLEELNVYAQAMGFPEWSNLSSFNDTHTHAEVLAAFDKAIAAERAKQEAAS